MSEGDEMLTQFRMRAARFSESMDEELDKIRAAPARKALDRALGLGIMFPVLTAKFMQVQGWFRDGHPIRPVDIFGVRSVAGDLRRIADALELAAERCEQEITP